MAQEKRRIAAEDLYRIQLLNDPQISPDGHQVILSVKRVDRKTNKQYSNLWLFDAEGGGYRQFTYGDQNDRQARWSPDGKLIAFLSDRESNEQSQLYLIPAQGGESRPLTGLKGDFGEFEWSPDGSSILCSFRNLDPDALERSEDKGKKELGVVYRRYTRAGYKLDGAGFLPNEKWHIWTVDVKSGKERQVTKGEDYEELSPRWSPDGKEILFFSNRSDRPDIDYHLSELYALPASGGPFRLIPTPAGLKSSASLSPDGKWVAFLCRLGKGNTWQNTNVWLVPADGSAPAVNLTGKFDIQVGSGTLTDTGERSVSPPGWSSDGQRLYFQVTRHGKVSLASVTILGKDLVTLVEGGIVGEFSLDSARERVAYFRGAMSDIGQVSVKHLGNHRSRQLTRFNQSWLRRIDLGQVEEIWYKGRDGNDLQGWILKPPGFDETKRYPSILEIHGGPLAQYGDTFMHEFYFLAAHGYVVHFTNPRGGQGYGEAHSRAIHRDWGGADYADLMTWTDLVAQKPYIDTGRMGVTGGSYGGYMTSWIIGHTDRFKAAVAQRVVSNMISFWGSSDMGYYFEDAWGRQGEPAWRDLETYWDHSPMKYIGNAKTPTMVIHSEQDWRCPLEQGEQLFLALRAMGVETELILFPDSPHGLSRVGRTDRRIARLNHILRWFDNYLK